MAANVETITVTAAGRGSVHNTLDGTNADAITIAVATGQQVLATLINRSAGDITFRLDGTAAVAGADGTYILPAGKDYPFIVRGTTVVSIIAGSALAYSLQAAPATDG
jgi:hypothetical protein